MTSNQNQVSLANEVDPVQQQLPQILHPLANLAFSFKGDLFYLAILAAMGICPSPDGLSAVIRELDGCSRWLADHGSEVSRREESVDTDGDGPLDLWRFFCSVDMLPRRLLSPKQQLSDLFDDGRVLLELVCSLK